MQETLAAAVVAATGWKGRGNFVNPMCGSGTLAVEAALVALNRAPGLIRKDFGFMHLRGFNRSSWNALVQAARSQARRSFPGKIVATDIDSRAAEASRQNAAAAGVDQLIEFGRGDYSATPVPEGGGVVILNPEYGERMGKVEQLKEVYRGIGDFFKKRCAGYTGFIFTGNLDLAKTVGLKARRRTPFFNSKIECRLLEYDLYVGSRREEGLQT
jgi:putative N6-adenine-specific DNA methylase